MSATTTNTVINNNCNKVVCGWLFSVLSGSQNDTSSNSNIRRWLSFCVLFDVAITLIELSGIFYSWSVYSLKNRTVYALYSLNHYFITCVKNVKFHYIFANLQSQMYKLNWKVNVVLVILAQMYWKLSSYIPDCPSTLTDCAECDSATVCTKCSSGNYLDGTCKGNNCFHTFQVKCLP